jgi:rSAM/selenodomain-associated transferase 2/rSAM/selenodomain-associated transferase 1
MDPETAGPATLVVFCRRPAPGVGKRRVAATAGEEVAWMLGERLLATTLEDAAAWPGPVVLAPASQGDLEWARQLLRRHATVVLQGDGNLGARLNRADRTLRAGGHDRLIFIGSDAPLLDDAYYAAARDALDQTDVVLGPAEDGGVTLMGSRVPWPDLAELPWSSPELGRALRARCEAHGLRVHHLPVRYDVDDATQLPRLREDLRSDGRPARRALRHWLDTVTPDAVSVIVPVLGDTTALAQLLRRLRTLSPPAAEIIVVDGGDSADCRHLCASEGALYVLAPAGRGRQLREGAVRARSPVLWFLHADAEPAPDAIALIRRAVALGARGGYFRFRFAGDPGPGRSLLAALINLRARLGVPYGDQGIFATREAYESAGGFADAPLFEEVPLVRGLRRAGRFACVNAPIGVSPRRWERDGWLRRTLGNRLLAVAYLAGVPPRLLARRYRGR